LRNTTPQPHDFEILEKKQRSKRFVVPGGGMGKNPKKKFKGRRNL